MNTEKACKILEINTNDLTKTILKKQYHKLALKYHPDKNGCKENFQEINEAYSYLINVVSSDSEFVSSNEEKDDPFDYISILTSFINTIIKGDYKVVITNIIKDILLGCEKLEISLFEKLDKETALEIYYFLSKYQDLLYISSDIICSVRNIIIEKYNKDKVYILKPSLQDLFENKVYKLSIDNEVYYVPLWHNEVYFDNKNDNTKDIIVFCLPELPENISIDENNNLMVRLSIKLSNIFLEKCDFISFLLDDKEYKIPFHKLYLKREQTYIFFKEGISKIEKDIYNIHEKSDIIVNISIS